MFDSRKGHQFFRGMCVVAQAVCKTVVIDNESSILSSRTISGKGYGSRVVSKTMRDGFNSLPRCQLQTWTKGWSEESESSLCGFESHRLPQFAAVAQRRCKTFVKSRLEVQILSAAPVRARLLKVRKTGFQSVNREFKSPRAHHFGPIV